MKKYLIGGVLGFIAAPVLGSLLLYVRYGIQPLYLLLFLTNNEPMHEERAAYSEGGFSYFTDYALSAPFLDTESDVSWVRPFGFFREEPVILFTKEDYQSVCLRSFDRYNFELEVTLHPEIRTILQDSFAETGEQFEDGFTDESYKKRYFLEAGGDLIKSFWVSDDGAEAYRQAVTNTPGAADFVLTVPMGQLENFLLYMKNDMTHQAPMGCTPDIRPEQIPVWEEIVSSIWR